MNQTKQHAHQLSTLNTKSKHTTYRRRGHDCSDSVRARAPCHRRHAAARRPRIDHHYCGLDLSRLLCLGRCVTLLKCDRATHQDRAHTYIKPPGCSQLNVQTDNQVIGLDSLEYCSTFSAGYPAWGVVAGVDCVTYNSAASFGSCTAAPAASCNVACSNNASESCVRRAPALLFFLETRALA